MKGGYTKYNGNNGYVRKARRNEGKLELEIGEAKMSDFVQAFSHWVYVQSDQQILLCDLQGVLNEEGRYPKFQLTDPCICTRNRKGKKLYGSTNVGTKAFRQFRIYHRCNNVCKGLGLQAFGRRCRKRS